MPPPPLRHTRAPGRVPAQYGGPPPPRVPGSFIAPPPRHGPQQTGHPAPPNYGYPQRDGEPMSYGRPGEASSGPGRERPADLGPVSPAQHGGLATATAPHPGGPGAPHEAIEATEAAEALDAPRDGDQAPSDLGPLAGFGARAVSFLVDIAVPALLLVALVVIGLRADNILVSLAVFWAGYLGLFTVVIWNSCARQGATGQSLGRRLTRTRLVGVETGEPVGFIFALLRLASHLVEVGIGFLWPLWDPRRQTFADKVVGTVVVRVRRGDRARAAVDIDAESPGPNDTQTEEEAARADS